MQLIVYVRRSMIRSVWLETLHCQTLAWPSAWGMWWVLGSYYRSYRRAHEWRRSGTMYGMYQQAIFVEHFHRLTTRENACPLLWSVQAAPLACQTTPLSNLLLVAPLGRLEAHPMVPVTNISTLGSWCPHGPLTRLESLPQVEWG